MGFLIFPFKEDERYSRRSKDNLSRRFPLWVRTKPLLTKSVLLFGQAIERNVINKFNSNYRVGKYKVNITKFERFLNEIPFLESSTGLIVIDEIGKMECFSERFKRLVEKILDSKKSIIATIALKGGGFIAEVKARKDIKLLEITQKNRDTLLLEILRDVRKNV